MRKNMDLDWFNILKSEIVILSIQLNSLIDYVGELGLYNLWIMEDINLCESYSKLTEMLARSNNDLTIFVNRIKRLDNQPISFEIEDIKDEYEFIRNNITLELSYLKNMTKYMLICKNQKMDDTKQKEECINYHKYDFSCYNQMKINNDGLKKLRKERRDSI